MKPQPIAIGCCVGFLTFLRCAYYKGKREPHQILSTGMLGSDDPFATAFGDDDETDTLFQPSQPIRDPNNGVLAFHHGTEYALLAFVQQEIQKRSVADAVDTSPAEFYLDTTVNPKLVQNVLVSVDQFCTERHWMMHVGPQKGCIVQDFLRERLQNHHDLNQREQSFNVVELGTYCGYSTVRMVDTLLRHTTNFHVYTIDVNPQTQNVAKQLIALAGLEKYVTFVLRSQPSGIDEEDPAALVSQLAEAMTSRTKGSGNNSVDNDAPGDFHFKVAPMIHFLFVDHAKELYLSDVQLLAANHFIQRQTAIAADNVVFFQLTAYRQYMMSLQTKGIVQTKLVSDGVFLEYADVPIHTITSAVETPSKVDVCDGLELTIFLKDHF